MELKPNQTAAHLGDSLQDLSDLRVLLDGHIALIAVESIEESRVIELFAKLLGDSPRPLYTWSRTDGLTLAGHRSPHLLDADPEAVLRSIKTQGTPSVYLLLDFHPFLDEPLRVRLLKDIAIRHERVPHTVVLVSHAVAVPPELRAFCARFELSLPGTAGLEAIVRDEARKWTQRNPGRKVQTERHTLQMLVRNLAGLTAADARRLARAAIDHDGAITEDDLPRIIAAKHRLLDRGGALTFEYNTARFAEVGGLANLKRWLELRRRGFFDPEPGDEPPKGMLLVGVQGSGKSLAAKAVAGTWSLPLLRFDFGALYNKYFGETERNLREALATAQLMAPCVLWIDEVEKAIAEGDNDAGTSRRMLGHLLTWMSERTSPVFVVTTANNIDRLPAELVRKGRLDEIFFIDLPDAEVRAEIFAIHLRKRALDPLGFDLSALAEASEGFSGAEIEQAVVAARYLARELEVPVETGHVLSEIALTQPLARVMAEKVEHLRAWASGRTVPAD